MTMLSDRDLATGRAHGSRAGAQVADAASWRLMSVPLLGLLALAAIVVLAGG